MSESDIFASSTGNFNHCGPQFVGYTARGCADRAMQANFAFSPSMVLVTMYSSPNVNLLFFLELPRPSVRRAT